MERVVLPQNGNTLEHLPSCREKSVCKILEANLAARQKLENVLRIDETEPTIAQDDFEFNIPLDAFNAFSDQETRASITAKLDAYIEILGALCSKYAKIDDVIDDVANHCKAAACCGEEGCLFDRVLKARTALRQLIELVEEDERVFKLETERAAWGNDYAFRIESPVSNWGIY